MKHIYSRVSTGGQSCDGQVSKLREMYPDAIVWEETASGIKARPVLQRLVESLQSGDTMVAWSLDRFGRRVSEILTMLEMLEKRGVTVRTQREGADMATPVGKLIISVLLSVSQLERDLISERTKLALDAKRKMGIVGGRKSRVTPEQVSEIRALRHAGTPIKAVAERFGVSQARVSQLCKVAA